MKKILLALVSLTSLSALSAHAGEIWLRTGGRLFRATVPVENKLLPLLTRDELIELLRDARIVEAEAQPSKAPKPWTESEPRRTSAKSWTETSPSKEASVAPWTETSK